MSVANSISPGPIQKLEGESLDTPPNTLEPKSYLSHFSFLERGFKYFGAGVALSVISIKTILPILKSGKDLSSVPLWFCFINYAAATELQTHDATSGIIPLPYICG